MLVEHQSSINENMPLRFLLYIARLYEKVTKPEDRYSRKLKKIPSPEFYVLYNGEDEYPTEKILKLSDNFIDSDDKQVLNLEVRVPVFNINRGKHAAVVEKCPTLAEYSAFVEKARTYGKEQGEAGFMTAIQECIEAGILKNYLERKTSEVINMLLAEYSYETDLKVQREEARQEGISQGLEQKARETAQKMMLKGFSVADIAEYTGLSVEEINNINKNG